jgi:predicted membrane protein
MLAYGALVIGTVVAWNRGIIVWPVSLAWAFALAFHRKAAVFRPLHMCLLASMDLREICKQVRVGRTSAIRQIVDLNANW